MSGEDELDADAAIREAANILKHTPLSPEQVKGKTKEVITSAYQLVQTISQYPKKRRIPNYPGGKISNVAYFDSGDYLSENDERVFMTVGNNALAKKQTPKYEFWYFRDEEDARKGGRDSPAKMIIRVAEKNPDTKKWETNQYFFREQSGFFKDSGKDATGRNRPPSFKLTTADFENISNSMNVMKGTLQAPIGTTSK